MSLLPFYRWKEISAAERRRILERSAATILSESLITSISALFEDVSKRGDAAVVDATAKFDKVTLEPSQLRVSEEEIDRAHASIDPSLLTAVRLAITNSRAFNEAQVELTGSNWQREIAPGHVVGEIQSPIPSAGLFVPCGRGSFPSVLAQIGTPAVVAGVPEIAVMVPPLSDGSVDGPTLAVARELGITKVFRANGPTGIAALSLGTETIPKVRKIVGPGSPAVAAAQVIGQRYGTGTNMLLGPSETLILADDSGDPERLAMDLINEGEHGPDSAVVLVTNSEALALAVDARVQEQLKLLPQNKAEWAHSALTKMGGVVLVDTMAEAVAFANDFAPEHVQIAVRDPEATLAGLHYAGEVLVGQDTPIAVSNITVGVPASLPTGTFAQLNGGITARTFQTAMSIAELTPGALAAITESSLRLLDHEGLPAHGNALRLRGLTGAAAR